MPTRLRIGENNRGRPATNGWYWLSLLTAGTIGTAIGDWVAEELHLGTGFGTLILTLIFAIVLTIGMPSRWATKAAYWLAIITVRAAGTTAGDWLAFRDDPGLINGLKLGLPSCTSMTCALFVGTLLLWKSGAPEKSTSREP